MRRPYPVSTQAQHTNAELPGLTFPPNSDKIHRLHPAPWTHHHTYTCHHPGYEYHPGED